METQLIQHIEMLLQQQGAWKIPFRVALGTLTFGTLVAVMLTCTARTAVILTAAAVTGNILLYATIEKSTRVHHDPDKVMRILHDPTLRVSTKQDDQGQVTHIVISRSVNPGNRKRKVEVTETAAIPASNTPAQGMADRPETKPAE